MRLKGEISLRNEEEKENDRNPQQQQLYSISAAGFPPQQKLVVGYALTLKKAKSFLQPKLEGLARGMPHCMEIPCVLVLKVPVASISSDQDR